MNSKLHPDIISLEKRLKAVVELEQYEIAAKIKQWIDELTIYYNSRYEKTNIHVCSR